MPSLFTKLVRKFGGTTPTPKTLDFNGAFENLKSTQDIILKADDPIKALKPSHPFKNKDNHLKLLEHCKWRLLLGKDLVNTLRERYRVIDQDMNGYVNLSPADRTRKRKNDMGEARKPTDMIVPIADAKIDELLTFLMQVFWPNEGMHNAYTNYKTQAIANSFALLMNKHGEFFKHYMKIEKWFHDGLKYNFSALEIDWAVEKGTKLSTNVADGVEFNRDAVLFEGNNLFNMDMYNFFFDPSVHPTEIADKAEFAAHVKMVSVFGLLQLANNGELTNLKNAFANGLGGERVFWQDHPIVRFNQSTTTAGGAVDWNAWSSNRGSAKLMGQEIAVGHFRIVPNDFGLSESKELEIWKIGILNGKTIVKAENKTAAHNKLPYVAIVPKDDSLFLQRKSPAEDLLDLQNFISFIYNLHTQSSRKSLFGITVYDPQFVDLKQAEGEVSAHIPTKRSVNNNGKIDDYIKQFRDSPDTKTLVSEAQQLYDMLEQILPTNILKQVTDLDRATTYQAAATVQGSNRRSLKMAKVLDDQAVKSLRFMMMSNIQELQPEIKITDPSNGEEIQIVPAKLRGLDLATAVGEGLQSIDKLMIIHLLHDVINAILQSSQASQEIDIVSLLNYWTTLIGDRTDLNQFRRTAPTLDQIMQLAQTAGIITDAKSTQAQAFTGGLQQAYSGNSKAVVANGVPGPTPGLNPATPPAGSAD